LSLSLSLRLSFRTCGSFTPRGSRDQRYGAVLFQVIFLVGKFCG